MNAPSWPLGYAADRRWADWEKLATDPTLRARVGAAGAELVATGVRELISNVVVHGAPGTSGAELRFEAETGTLSLVIPGNEFDSVARARSSSRGFLPRFHALLTEDGVTWTHHYENGENHLVFRLSGARFWVECKEKVDA